MGKVYDWPEAGETRTEDKEDHKVHGCQNSRPIRGTILSGDWGV